MKKLILVGLFSLFSVSSTTFADNNVNQVEDYKSYLKIGTEVLITHRAYPRNPRQYQIGIITGFNADRSMNVELIQTSLGIGPSEGPIILAENEFKYLNIRCLSESTFPKCVTPEAKKSIQDGQAVYTNGRTYKIEAEAK